jgi:hypothetical protein
MGKKAHVPDEPWRVARRASPTLCFEEEGAPAAMTRPVGSKAGSTLKELEHAELKELLKKSGKQISRGLKSARNDKCKGRLRRG